MSKALRNGGSVQEEADDESWGNWFSNIISAFTRDDHLPKRFRTFIKLHGREKIKDLKMVRAPVARPGVWAMELLTAGRWEEFKKRGGVDETYHTSLLINDHLVVEKIEKLEARQESGHEKGAETFDVDLKGKDLSIAEFLENGRKKMGTSFYTYSALNGNNCQDFVYAMVSSNGLMTDAGHHFIKQDLEKLIKELPNTTKIAAQIITNEARNVGNIKEELLNKKGGRRHRFEHMRHHRFGH